ncbi:metabotropic glutamate receptor 8-like [Amphiura filiformis]|uniref:metabotropic glutamate receptor 8-like n=1 Tax=Amphiura filiformis TaxID=82378 RepID=UPI003B21A611
MFSEAMIWAVEDINARTDVLPNITIGYEIRDGCSTEDISLWSSLSYFTDTCDISPQDRDAVNLVALVSAAASVTTVWMSKVANLFHIPLLSATSTSDELSDIVRFPYFFRTVPPDRLQVAVIIDILLKFNWKYIALINSADTYGLHGGRQVKAAAEKTGICIAMSATIQPYAPKDEVEDAVDRLLKFPKAKVVVMFSLSGVASSILSTINKRNLALNLTWIGSDGWGTEFGEVATITTGSIFIRPFIFYFPTPAFAADFASRDPGIFSGTPWYHDYWQQWKASQGCSNITQCPMYPVSGAPVINAVYAVAHALHSFYTDSCRRGPCISPKSITGPMLKQYLLNVSFNGPDGVFEFDQHGDTFGTYQRTMSTWTHNDTFRREMLLWMPSMPKKCHRRKRKYQM